MTSNELTLTNQDIEVKPAVIKFNKYEEAKAYVDAELDKWTNYVVTAKDVKSAKDVCAELNKRKAAIDTFRKSAVNQANKPVNEFENQMKELAKEYKVAYDSIRKQVKTYEDKAHEDRLNLKIKRMKEMCEEVGIDPDKIVINDSWGNVSFSNKKFEEEVKAQLELLLEQKKQFEENQRIIAQRASELEIDAEPYLDLLNSNYSPAVILEKMRGAHERELQQKEAKEEAKAKEKENLVVKNNKLIDKRTGESKGDILKAELVFPKGTYKLEGTKKQFSELLTYLAKSGLKAKRVE